MELLLAVGILALTSAIATNAVTVPTPLTSTASGVVALLVGLFLSASVPMTGIAIIVLAIVLLFKRNVNNTIQSTLQQFEAEREYPPTAPNYGENTIPMDKQNPPTGAAGYETIHSGPRNYTQDIGNIEGFTPATIEQSEELNPPKGQYPTNEPRETAFPVADEYTYRPAPDTGSNEFRRFGPQMDEKVNSFRYYA